MHAAPVLGTLQPGSSRLRLPAGAAPHRWEPNSIGYHGDDGHKFCNGRHERYGPTFGTGDYVGAGINTRTGEVFFT